MQNYSYLKPSSRQQSRVVHEHTPGSRAVFGVPPSAYSSEEDEAVHRLREYLRHKNPNKTSAHLALGLSVPFFCCLDNGILNSMPIVGGSYR